ncbi:MAG: response regulator transcription factor [Bacteroidota bacterium]
MTKIRMAIVDDEALFRKGMRLLLDEYEDIEILFTAEHGQDLLDQLEKREDQPDLVLMDLQMPVMNGVDCTKALQKQFPDLRIVILTTHYSKSFIINMIELGAASYLPKDSDPEDVILTLREVMNKGFYYNDHVMAVIRQNMVNKIKRKSLRSVNLTNREQEVLQLICQQFTTSEIAQKLFISPRTVDGHRNSLLEKTNAKNTAGLVVFALENKIVELDRTWFD